MKDRQEDEARASRTEPLQASSTLSSSLSASASGLRLTPRRLLLLGLLGLLIVAVLIVVGGAEEVWRALVHADWRLLALGLLVHYSGFAVRGHRWQLLLGAIVRHSGSQSSNRPGYLYVTAILISGWFVSALLPARAGDAFRVAALRLPPVGQPRIPIADSLGSIILERTLDIVALLLLSASIGALLLGGGFPRWLTTFYVGGLALVVLGLGLLIGIPSLLERLQGWIHHRWWQVGLELLGRISVSLRALPRHPLLMTGVLLESFYIWLCDAVLLWLVIWSLDQPIPFPDAAFVALTADVFAAVPLTPGGVGQIESAYALLLSLLPSAPFNIPAAILATRAISYWSFLLVSGMIIIATGMGRLIFRQASVMGGTAGQVEPTQQRERADG